jgi:hypothetical protein
MYLFVCVAPQKKAIDFLRISIFPTARLGKHSDSGETKINRFSDIESEAINGGYLTNYFRVSRGVRQGCALSPLLFILCVELLAQKMRQNPKITGIELPYSCEAKLSQLADDTTLICKDTSSLHESISVLGRFGDISGLKLNSKKTKAMWTGSLKNNKTKPLEINVSMDPIKTLGAYISYDSD